MDSINIFSSSSKKKKGSHQPVSFIEALKDIGSSVQKQAKDATIGTGKAMADQLLGGNKNSDQVGDSGELQPETPFNFEDYLKSREKQIEQVQKQKFESRIQEERLVFHRKEEEAKLEIKAVQEELKKLAESTEGLSVEIKKATFTATVNPGTYHENFFSRIKRLIQLARKKLVESQTWLESFNYRSQRKSAYWGGVKKSGTKFMLSQERYTATKTG
ncbi:hypothetical protein COT75_00455 [Candidatus Beckwithbacteria bacterium CG10_big_fil_rev_8_21_14_0_10_34_10]|uniref:DUF5660 domain-containing protein n=1 Tax=Candidatus Beckwithbacteria bacterium CG10_big_fil_rev_8_21_14_0_10_34_10 TaxID=1974495 RepID=A0A2H0WAR7_9BACT|nr:MAG: hypothetical protein COT75_00455 [Candidatus Beckwithbacteria bacterium CG10_big_fil_rev_8_21_14_0_10_34_10]